MYSFKDEEEEESIIRDYEEIDIVEYKEEENDQLKDNLLNLALNVNDEEMAKIIIDMANKDELEKLLLNITKDKLTKKKTLTFWLLMDQMSDAAEMCFDKYFYIQKSDKKYELDFILLDRKALETRYGATTTTNNEIKKLNDNTMHKMVKSNNEDLLKHPYVLIYINSQWNFLSKLSYYGGFFLYTLFVIFLTLFILLKSEQFPNELLKDLFESLVFALSLILLIKEIYQLYVLKLFYLTLENILDFSCFLSTIIMLFPFYGSNSLQFEFGIVAIVFSYIALGFYSKRIPKIGIYSAAIMQVTKTILKFLLVISVYIIGFSLSFYLLFKHNTSSSSSSSSFSTYKWSWILRTFSMMIGDFSYDDLINNSIYSIKYLIFSLFLIALPIVINNIIISFSINDTRQIIDNASLQTLKTEISFLLTINNSIKFKTIDLTPAYRTRLSKYGTLDEIISQRSNINIINSTSYQVSKLYLWKTARQKEIQEDDELEENTEETIALKIKLEKIQDSLKLIMDKLDINTHNSFNIHYY